MFYELSLWLLEEIESHTQLLSGQLIWKYHVMAMYVFMIVWGSPTPLVLFYEHYSNGRATHGRRFREPWMKNTWYSLSLYAFRHETVHTQICEHTSQHSCCFCQQIFELQCLFAALVSRSVEVCHGPVQVV